jgi:predicted O-methyltransferase YrrM
MSALAEDRVAGPSEGRMGCYRYEGKRRLGCQAGLGSRAMWKNWVRRALHSLLGDEVANATKNWVRRSLRPMLVDEVVGAVEYMIYPDRGTAWGGPFNGQRSRQDLFHSLVERFAPIAIVETGTYLGTTTEFFAATEVPIFSVEGNPRHYGFARARLCRRRNVNLLRGDSRAALRTLFDGPLRGARNHNLFVYLDAHWNEDLPLAEELEIVFGACPNAIVMVDDFHVPFDTGYGYDDYGVGRVLAADYIERIVATHGLRVFYPSTSSAHETGVRRGCVVLAKNTALGQALASLPLVREAASADHM